MIPGTASVELLLAAGRELLGDIPLTLADVSYRTPLVLPGAWERTIQIEVDPERDGAFPCRVTSTGADDEESTLHVEAALRTPAASAGRAPVAARAAATPQGAAIPGRHFSADWAQRGNQWEGAFQGIQEYRAEAGSVVASVLAPPSVADQVHRHRVHPALLDACAHVVAAALPATSPSADDVFVLGGIDGVQIQQPGRHIRSCRAQLRDQSSRDSFVGDVVAFDADGEPVAELTGLRLRYLVVEQVDDSNGDLPSECTTTPVEEPMDGELVLPADLEDMLYELQWRDHGVPTGGEPTTTDGTWLVLTDSSPVGRSVVSELGRRGARVIVATPGVVYSRTAENSYRLDPADPDQLVRLLEEIHQDDQLVAVVHLWSLGAAGAQDPTPAQLHRFEALTVTSVAGLVRAMGNFAGRAPRLYLATAGAQSAELADPVRAPFQAPLWGIGRALAQEQPDLRVTCADIGHEDGSAEAFASVLLTDDDETEFLVRGCRRLVARLARRGAGASGAAVGGPGPREVVLTIDHIGPTGLAGHGECVGTVAALGDAVTAVALGDKVIAIVPAPWSTSTFVPSAIVTSWGSLARPLSLAAHDR